MTDQNARARIATELDTSFMVEAAAGTGKTTSMVARMLNLVTDGICPLPQLAAVTFTRKAAAELRSRFQSALSERIDQLSGSTTQSDRARLARLRDAQTAVSRGFIGTIHSFCAMLIRERPIEFGVSPDFRELEADEDDRLREQAWQDNLSDLAATGDPMLGQLKTYGLQSTQLKDSFHNFIQYRDIEHWPTAPTEAFDLKQCRRQVLDYIDNMRRLLPTFPSERPSDKLMNQYELIVRASNRAGQQEAKFFRLLELFDHDIYTTIGQWSDRDVGKVERDRFKAFREDVIKPAMTYWRQRRYEFVVTFIRRAVDIFARMKAATGGLDFTDLLLVTANGLRRQPHLRKYFQSRFTHLLVDEFQDTDPIQAEAVILLCSDDAENADWQSCRLRPGSLFIVGDPKQSIFRFRRGDIVTYNRVQEVVQSSGGEVLSLSQNFRSRQELLDWNNALFADKFPAAASDYAPAPRQMFSGHQHGPEGALTGLRKLTISNKNKAAIEEEAERIAEFIGSAIEQRLTIERWSSEKQAFISSAVEANDFLIITRNKPNIASFKAALERRAILCDVSGSNAYSALPQLATLLNVIKSADDPYDSVAYLTLLRDQLFGFSDAELYALKEAGGSFKFAVGIPEQLCAKLRHRFESVSQQMQHCQVWLRALPPLVALEKIAASLGLLSQAASSLEGDIELGSMLKAFEALRCQSHRFDYAADLISGLTQLLDDEEAEGAAAMTTAAGAVRIMNLHKAKGLEAPIVFLADVSRPPEHKVDRHIARQNGTPLGAMAISQKLQYHTKPIAEPVDWAQYAAEESRFIEAERQRLLYVATTRAASMLVVSVADGVTHWSDLYEYLETATELALPIPQPSNAGAVASTAPTLAPPHSAAVAVPLSPTDRWLRAREPGYQVKSVKKEALRGVRRPDWNAEGDYGMTWGTALHQLLEMASKAGAAGLVDLKAQAWTVAEEYGIEVERVDELASTVQAVLRSDIWKRSQASARCYSELPFDLAVSSRGVPTIVRGVIDLIFEEPAGWTIVDYKSDSITVDDLQSIADYYRPQLQDYARYWTQLTGHPVQQCGIYLSRVDRYVEV